VNGDPGEHGYQCGRRCKALVGRVCFFMDGDFQRQL
jgi:hypothetical protein